MRKAFYDRRQRKGVTLSLANDLLRQPNYFGPMMVAQGDADVFSPASPTTIRR